ncbi:hypothetical protein [Cupriavidus basilensis]|uniref:hypothetical protein n=1 Tax=Cupriavidus basilensis TaxID=68895 RepID=UPI0005BE3038|nr:hypothetical protein [Cupriavidus basilensis]
MKPILVLLAASVALLSGCVVAPYGDEHRGGGGYYGGDGRGDHGDRDRGDHRDYGGDRDRGQGGQRY